MAKKQAGLFDWQARFAQLDEAGDPLKRLNDAINWERFRPSLLKVREKERKSDAGRKPFDEILMFKILIIESLYNIADDRAEFLIRDRLSFMRFLGLELCDTVPDAKTIWLFREHLGELGLERKLFDEFEEELSRSGFSAKKGQIIDASIVSVPKQRNSREENEKIKDGEIPDDWSENKKRQKDTDARWTKKNGKSYFGYKNHVQADVKHKIIRDYDVTNASVHDSQVFEGLLDEGNSSRDVWADSAYRSEERLALLDEFGYREHIQRKGCRHRKLTEREKQGNRTRSRIRSRIEHVFGVQAKRAGNLILRTIGIVRARIKIGLRNLAYNLDRYAALVIAR
jgi:IS5 family transposase